MMPESTNRGDGAPSVDLNRVVSRPRCVQCHDIMGLDELGAICDRCENENLHEEYEQEMNEMPAKESADVVVDAAQMEEIKDLRGQLHEMTKDNADRLTECGKLRVANAKLLEACKAAEMFVGWYRNMAIEGQISVTNYALGKRPVGWGGDYELMKCIENAIAQAANGRTD